MCNFERKSSMTENRNWLDNVRRIHFIGIGGSGMSPLAEILHAKGYALSGSDNNESDNPKKEQRQMFFDMVEGYGIPLITASWSISITCPGRSNTRVAQRRHC